MDPLAEPVNGLFPEQASNGHAQPSRGEIERALLSGQPAHGYRPNLPVTSFTGSSTLLPPLQLFYSDLPAMLACGSVEGPLNNFKSGLAQATFEVEASSPAVQAFAESMIDRFWDRSLGQVQGGYEWGWGGFCPRYWVEDGLLTFDGLYDFAPNDVRPLAVNGVYVGMRVVRGLPGGPADLWGPGKAPPKAFWYTHRPKHGQLYGRSQVYAAHRPWRRLEGRDGADEICDAAVYRQGYRGPKVRFPSDQRQAKSQQSQGQREPNRELALQIGEQSKAGANLALPSDRDTKGEYLWDVEYDDHTLDVSPLLEYGESLEVRISKAIGWPPELTEASETGSGYSGRNVPKEMYFAGQQEIGKNVLTQFKEQVLDPLIKWNFGRGAWCHVKLQPLLPPAQPGPAAAVPGQLPGESDPAKPPGARPGSPGQPPPANSQPPQLRCMATAFDPSEPRDEAGRWAAAGAALSAHVGRHRQATEAVQSRAAAVPKAADALAAAKEAWKAKGPQVAAQIKAKNYESAKFRRQVYEASRAQHFREAAAAHKAAREAARAKIVADAQAAHVALRRSVRKELAKLTAALPKAQAKAFAKALHVAAEQMVEAADRRLATAFAGTRRLATEPPAPLKLADDRAERIAKDAAAALAKLSRAARDELLAAVTGEGTPAERLARARAVLEAHRVAFARSLGDARLAAALAGMGGVADGLPATAHRGEAGPPPPPPDELAEVVAALKGDARTTALGILSPERRKAVEAAVELRTPSQLPPPEEPPFPLLTLSGEAPEVHLPLIEEAVKNLLRRRVFTRGDFDVLDAQARASAFTVAGVESQAALEKVRDVLAEFAGGKEGKGFRERIEEAVGEGTFLSDAHTETVYRTTVNGAYSEGQQRLLEHPMVEDHFPYRAVYPIHDDRVRPWHLATETHGLNGTNVYRADDPVWETIRPVSDYSCRCGWAPLTVQMAADAGVTEAREWLRAGTPPTEPGRASLPADWQQSPGFRRMATETDEGGRWITIGGRKGDDGKRHGGSPVYVKNGRITKGAASLAGQKIGSLGKEQTASEARHTERHAARSRWAKEAKTHGVHPEHLHQLAGEMLAHDREHVKERTQLLKEARTRLNEYGGQWKTIGTNAGSGRFADADSIRGLDEVAEDLSRKYPEQFRGEHEHPSDRLFDLLAEGNPDAMSEDEALSRALHHLRESIPAAAGRLHSYEDIPD